MALQLKQQIHDREGLKNLLNDMAERICADDFHFQNLAMIGIMRTGAPIADYLAKRISEVKGVDVPVAYMDITLYRDDMIDSAFEPFSRQTEIPFAVKNREIILVDDVLFTGRTVRAALTSIVAQGRPKLVRLAVVVDRGHRELPIRADYVGMTLSTSRREGVRVRINAPDQETGIYLYEESAT
ncbi:MAG: bifunctional pyr operon transcriptional regulator/uracil phosphoribosyltransferase PyrR [Acidobacteria bacterium]|nr:bifunctional pyr operon transcriptional regulator/uracil phosphoribosyltransferase PyrR [Acidobacteriota bacterium]